MHGRETQTGVLAWVRRQQAARNLQPVALPPVTSSPADQQPSQKSHSPRVPGTSITSTHPPTALHTHRSRKLTLPSLSLLLDLHLSAFHSSPLASTTYHHLQSPPPRSPTPSTHTAIAVSLRPRFSPLPPSPSTTALASSQSDLLNPDHPRTLTSHPHTRISDKRPAQPSPLSALQLEPESAEPVHPEQPAPSSVPASAPRRAAEPQGYPSLPSILRG